MNVLAIIGSPKKKDTYGMIKAIDDRINRIEMEREMKGLFR